ncbi:MAG: exodeoxyribonuclease VII large subunit [Clostridiales bacterium]|nr:exodeoxyribonuclease VII large subunit [Clostridiales bacterium]
MSESYISVSQLNTYIRNIFEAEVMLQNIFVYGEVSSYNISNGIAYFNLKDEAGLLSCVLFGANNFKSPKIGDMVVVRGSMNYYAKGGKLSFNAYSIMPYGKGLLYEKFLELKARLQEKGYFAEEIKKPIPQRVKRIGVVTSPTGAVIRDIIDVTHRRNNTIDIVLYPVKVQGVGADSEIARGIDFFSEYRDVDVVIVARGGGSLEDLEPFNSEIVADSAFACKKPLVSAVGHETDFTIIDFVADLRAPTPSAAAELVAWDKYLELEKINKATFTMEKELRNKLSLITKDIDISLQKIDNLSRNNINTFVDKVNTSVTKLGYVSEIINNKEKVLDKLFTKLESLDPKKLSSLGYSKILQDGRIVTKTKDLDKKKDITISMIDGKLSAKITD